jgi:uroporphyrinogen-III synthase
MRALVTRPEEDSAALVAALRARGIEPVIEPMLSVAPEGGEAIALDGVQALLFTSANGVREFSRRETKRDLPVYAVGDASARAARAAGFADVKSAGRDAEALAKLVGAELKPAGGALLHARGRDTTGHLEAALKSAGFEVRDPVVYRADAARRLSEPVKKMLADGGIELALFFSPRTARGFVSAVEDAGIAPAMGKVTAICLSRAVADALAPLSFARVAVAAAPNQDSLLAAIPSAKPRRTWVYAAAAVVLVAVAGVAAWLITRPMPNSISIPIPTATRPATETPPVATGPAPSVATSPVPSVATAPAPPREDPRIAEMQQELSALRTQLEAVPGRLDSLAAAQDRRMRTLQDHVAALQDRIAALEESARKGGIAQGEFLIATALLRDAVARGAPYAAPLDAIAALARDDAELRTALEALRPGAATGIATAPMLAARIEPVASQIARAALAPPGASWLDRLTARLSALVTVRRTGADAEGVSADAVAARAEVKAKAGDLAGAVAELATLTGAPAAAARGWVADARARLEADAVLDRLSALALQRLAKPE